MRITVYGDILLAGHNNSMRDVGREYKGGINFDGNPKLSAVGPDARMLSRPGCCLYLDLAAELDDAIWRNAKELGRVERVVRHHNEQHVAPAPEVSPARVRP